MKDKVILISLIFMMIICIVIIASLYLHVYKIFYVSSVILLLMFLISPIIWDKIDN